MSNLLIFGNGAIAQILINQYLNLEKNTIIGFINSLQLSTPSTPTCNGEIPMIPLNKIEEVSYDYLIIASGYFDEMYEQCLAHNVPTEKIIGVVQDWSNHRIIFQEYLNKKINDIFNIRQSEIFIKEVPTYYCGTLFLSNELYINDNLAIFEEHEKIDILRSMVLKTLIHEIKRKKIRGNLAELGVYKGAFARIMNHFFADKKLYLFDSYNGFDEKDLVVEDKLTKANAALFKDTNANLVLSQMEHKDNCIVVKGFFPKSSIGIEDTFALVSIDVDLYRPTYKGLEYFYPRLSSGGYILVHDFNNTYFSGVRKAVEKFCKQEKVGYIPIPDYNGTAIITK